ncbi:GNAT family N-acetyltransferase [Microbacterium aureliae]
MTTDSAALTADGASRAAWLAHALDDTSSERLAAHGLDYRRVDVREPASFDPWLQAVARGFLDGERSPEQLAAIRERSGYRRATGVFDPTGPVPEMPVGTIASWIGELTLPGEAGIPSCAISAVTVAPTHRRRGIARAMLEGELRAAAAAGAPMAMLTVSESTLYGRYGFAPAAAAASWTLDVKRASWIGPAAPGRVDFIPRERLRALIPAVHDGVRLRTAGEIDVPAGHWDAFARTRPDMKDAGDVRAIQYADEAGEVRGLALYTVKGNDDDFTKSTVTVEYLVADGDDAYAALWRFFVELDLVGEVHAHQLSIDEPLWWMISDQRAATITVADHQYVRILDIPRALSQRRFGAPGRIRLEVGDPLGLASGSYLLEADTDGRASIERVTPDAAGAGSTLTLGVAELAAISLGGVSVATLAAAGRVRASDPEPAARVFGWHTSPRLSFWY